jgi:excinuclease ABC subunit C
MAIALIMINYNMFQEFSKIPRKPGVYIFKAVKERVLYVGKAKNLRSRMRSYFLDSANLEPRKAAMVRQVRDFSYIVTDNELEALILEANLIKQYKPKFNIILRDDKNYPYIKIKTAEEWPSIEVVRKAKKDGNFYFGPYVPAQAMWEALAFIRRNFLIRTCGYSLDKPMRPCVQHQMKRCSAPCAGLVSKEEYRKIIDEVMLFLKGEKRELLKNLEDRMHALSEEMRFEDAAKIRDRIFKLQRAFESQKVVSPELGDIDVIGYYIQKTEDGFTRFNVAINVLFIRNGILIGAKDFFIDNIIASNEAEMLHSFIELFYSKEIIPPAVILVNVMPAEIRPLKAWLKKKKEESVNIEVPADGKKMELLHMANENARLHFGTKKKSTFDEILEILKDRLHLAKVPLSIGAFDVSTIQGSESVGAFIYWENGAFKNDKYRHLKIKSVAGVDDYAMMHEIVERVLVREHLMPDLVVIDGGKGQLEVARKVMEDLHINTDLIAVAKKPDRAFILNDEIIDLEDKSKESLLLKKIRDEVHRFAITFHRKLRDKRLMESQLEKIPGIGKKRRLELLRHFGSIDNIRNASAEEIAAIKGFNSKIAKKVKETL